MKKNIKTDKIDKEAKTIIFRDFITTDILPPPERTDRPLRDQLECLLGAGTEPVAHVLRIITYHLSQNTSVLQKLRAEIAAVQLSPNGLPDLEQLEEMSYLTALIKEGLRLSYGVASRMPRIAPDRTLNYGDWEIPPGTAVSMTPPSIFHDENIFPDSHSYSPERFLDPVNAKGLSRCFAPFSRGTRSCLGQQYVNL